MSYAPEFRYFDGQLDGIDPNGTKEIVIPAPTPETPFSGISGSAFYKCQDVESIVVPEGVTEFCIGRNECLKSLKKIVLPSTLRKIEKGTFKDLDALESVILCEGTETIAAAAFQNCVALKHMHLPSTLKKIGEAAFECCASLESITLPKGIELVAASAFKDCPRLTLSFEEGMSEEKKADLSALLLDCFAIYEVCPFDGEPYENVERLDLNGCYPCYHEGKIAIRSVSVSREQNLALFEQTRPYHIVYGFSSDRSSALCRSVRPNEAVYRDGKFYGIRANYHDEGDYCDRTWQVTREPSDTPFVLEIGKDAKTHISCFCHLTERPTSQSEQAARSPSPSLCKMEY